MRARLLLATPPHVRAFMRSLSLPHQQHTVQTMVAASVEKPVDESDPGATAGHGGDAAGVASTAAPVATPPHAPHTPPLDVLLSTAGYAPCCGMGCHRHCMG